MRFFVYIVCGDCSSLELRLITKIKVSPRQGRLNFLEDSLLLHCNSQTIWRLVAVKNILLNSNSFSGFVFYFRITIKADRLWHKPLII